jgi:DNA polymerase-3 subunit epsilon
VNSPPLPDALEQRPIGNTDFVVVDVETTGMNAVDGRMTEIAMMRVCRGHIVDEFSTLINPLMTIPAFITSLTGIDNIMVADAPTAREVAPFITEFLDGAVFVAHNVSFDWGFVSETVKREQRTVLGNPRLCTVRLSRRLLPHLPSKSLGPVAQHMKVRIPERHRASGDAYATAQIFIQFTDFLQERGIVSTTGDLLKFQYRRSSLIFDEP